MEKTLIFWLVFIFSTYTLTRAINVMHVGRPLRVLVSKLKIKWLDEFICCPFCLGFWVGMGMSLLMTLVFEYQLSGFFVFDGLVGSGLTYLIVRFEPPEDE